MSKLLHDEEMVLARELVAEMGECAASYHIIIQISEIERLRADNKALLDAAEAARNTLSKYRNIFNSSF